MAIIDPRLEMARRARNGARAGNVVSLRQMLQPGVAGPQRAADTSRTEMNSLENYARTRFQDTGRELEALKIARGQQKQADPGGFQGLLVDILENPVTKTILKPLQILDVPRRAVISGIHELSDAIGSGDASWDDFMSQAKDPNYGVGQYIDTGNKWVDRALGFIGDVALDPLTYATLGASKAAGASGRLALSSNMLRKGMSAERAATVARVGRSALTAAERSELGLKRAGVYFFGKRLAERRLPMSGGVGSMTEKGLAGLRLAATDRGVGKFLQRAFTPDVNKTARLQVLRGELPAGEAAQFIQTIESRNIQRAAAGEAQALSQVELGELVKLVNPDLRASVHQVLDGAREATDAERPLADAVRSWLNAKWDDIEGRMTAADPQSGFGKIEDRYLPWMRTEDARRYQSDPTSPYLGELKKGFDDGDPLSVFNHRSLASKVNAGESVDWFGTKLTKDDLYVDRLNELARAGGFSGDFFETDIVTILERYAMQHAEQAGLAARYGALKAVGVMDTLDSKLVRREVFDEDAVAAQVGRVKSFAKQHADAHAEASAAVAKLRDELDNSGSAIAQRLKAIENQRFDAATIASNLRPEVDGLQKALGSASVKLQASYDELHRLFDGAVPEVAEASAAGALRAQRLLDGLFDDVGALLGDTPGVSVKELKRQLDKVGKEITELGSQQARMVEFNEVIAANWERVSAGSRSGDKAVDDIAMSLGLVSADRGFASRAGKAAATAGEMQKWVKNEMPKASWWKRVAGRSTAPIVPSNVAGLNRTSVERTLVRSSSSAVSLADLRSAAAWVLARDEKFYGGIDPQSPLAQAMEGLLVQLDKAADADDLARRLGAVETRELRQIQRKSVQLNVDVGELEELIKTAQEDVVTFRLARQALRLGEFNGQPLDNTVLNNLRGAINEFAKKEYTLGQGNSTRAFKLGDFFFKERTVVNKAGNETVERYGSRADDLLELMQNKFTFSPEDAKRWKQYGSPAKAKAELADALQHYYVISDTQHRFNLAARMMAWSGLVPSEAMLRSTVQASAKRWAGHWDARMKQLLTSQGALTDIADEWTRRAPNLSSRPGASAAELRRMFDEAFSRPGGEALRQHVGPALAAAEDPKVMLKKMKHTAYRNDVVKPWYESLFGRWQGVDAAKARLREAKASGRSPFAASATADDVQAFLTEMIGGFNRSKRISARSVGQTVKDTSDWRQAVSGTLLEEFRRTEAQQRLFHGLLDPNVDVDALLQGSTVGSFYAGALKRAADDIDAMSTTGPFSPRIPNGTDPQFVAKARKDMDRLRRRKNSVDYDIALGDQELHEGIMDLARFDLWRAQSADGQPGFFLPNGTQVVDAQGVPLVFSKVEADSLFQAPMTAEQAKQVRSRMGSISNELGQARKNLEGLLASPNYKRNGEIRPYLFPQKQELEQDIRAMSEELRDLRNAAEASLPQTQAAALSKVRILVDGDESWLRLGVPMRKEVVEPGVPGTPADLSGLGVALEEAEMQLSRAVNDMNSMIVPSQTATDRVAAAEGAVREAKALVDASTERLRVLRADLKSVRSRRGDPRYTTRNERQAKLYEELDAIEKRLAQPVPTRKQSVEVASKDSRERATAMGRQAQLRDELKELSGQARMPERSPEQIRDEIRVVEDALTQQRWRIRQAEQDLAQVQANRPADRIEPVGAEVRKAKIAEMQRRVDTLRHQMSLNPVVGGVPERRFSEPVVSSFLADSPNLVRSRMDGQTAAHASTPSRKLLDEIDELEQSVTVNAWRGWAGNTVAVRQHTDTMRSVAAQREAQIAEMQLAVRQAELAIPLAEKRERAYQLMNSFNEKVDTAREAAIVAARGEREAASAVIGQTEKTLAVVGHKYDTARAVVDEMNELMQTTVPRLQERLGVVEKALTDAPVKASADSIDWLQSARQELEMVVSNPEDPISKVVANAIDLEADWLISGQKLAQAQSFLNDLERGKVDWVVEFEKARDGWKTMDAAGLPGLQAPQQIADMLVSMQRIEQPGFAREVNRLFGNYTRFFKSYATLSPGFHVRNIMSNSFVLVASGADPRALTQGFGLWKGLRQSIRDGKGVDTWLATLPEADRAVAEVAARTMFAAGGGHTSDQVADLLRVGKGKVLDNKVLRASQKVGDSYESASRFMLAYDTAVSAVKNGQAPDINEAAARVKQFLFDYRDLSVADQNMRAVVPFWIWMSRNLPMQIMNQWANPKAYAGYNSLMRNIAEPGDDNDIMPSWLDEQGGVKIGEDLYLRPDLGFTRLGEQLAEVGDLPRLLSYVNPAMRVPVEVLGSRQLYNDVPFSENPQSIAAGPLSGPLGSLAEMLGLGQRNAEGQVVVDPRVNHVLKNMLPPLAQAERLMPSSAVGVDRQSNSALGILGVPVTRVTPSMKASELARRKREMEELALSSSRLGFQP